MGAEDKCWVLVLEEVWLEATVVVLELLRPEEFCLETPVTFKLPEEFCRGSNGLSLPPPLDTDRETRGEMPAPAPAELPELCLCPMGLEVREGLELSLCPEELGLEVLDPIGLEFCLGPADDGLTGYPGD
nr:hypothetical protein BaRGS_031028 [Batillaria attramentaria]